MADVNTGTGADKLVLKISEDRWRGDAQFTVKVNGVQQGGTFTATALHKYGQDQNFIFNGAFGQDPTVDVTFLNDRFGGNGSHDRNLYVDGASYDGVTQNVSAELLWNQTVEFHMSGGGTVEPPPPPPPPPPPSDNPSFYVSTSGNDSGDGSQANPFKTLARAQQAMQGSTIKTTEIEAGTYSLGAWNLSSSDSGETWVSHSGAVLDGHGSGYVNAPHVNNLTIEGLTFQNLGIAPNTNGGVNLGGDSGDTIRWNTFLNSKQEVLVGGGLQNSLIDSNTIDGVGPGNPPGVTTFAYTAIDFWLGSSGNTVSHNLIQNTQGGGISFATGASDPPINNNVIDSNKLINVDTNVVDIGAIYLEDRTHRGVGNKITNNVIDGYGNGSLADQTKGIYLDDVVSNVTITGNLVYGTPGEWGIQFHGGDHDSFKNNIFALAPGEQLGLYQDYTGSTGMNANEFQNNIVYYSGQPPSSLWHISGTGMALPNDNTNLYYAADGSAVPNNGVVDTNPFRTDPQFASPGSGDFSLAPGSPAYADLGWQNLATNQGPLPANF